MVYKSGMISLNATYLTKPNYSADEMMHGNKFCYTISMAAKTQKQIKVNDVLATLPFPILSRYVKETANRYQFLFIGTEIRANTSIPQEMTFEIFDVFTGA